MKTNLLLTTLLLFAGITTANAQTTFDFGTGDTRASQDDITFNVGQNGWEVRNHVQLPEIMRNPDNLDITYKLFTSEGGADGAEDYRGTSNLVKKTYSPSQFTASDIERYFQHIDDAIANGDAATTARLGDFANADVRTTFRALAGMHSRHAGGQSQYTRSILVFTGNHPGGMGYQDDIRPGVPPVPITQQARDSRATTGSAAQESRRFYIVTPIPQPADGVDCSTVTAGSADAIRCHANRDRDPLSPATNRAETNSAMWEALLTARTLTADDTTPAVTFTYVAYGVNSAGEVVATDELTFTIQIDPASGGNALARSEGAGDGPQGRAVDISQNVGENTPIYTGDTNDNSDSTTESLAAAALISSALYIFKRKNPEAAFQPYTLPIGTNAWRSGFNAQPTKNTNLSFSIGHSNIDEPQPELSTEFKWEYRF